jgi:thiamine-monophosphate kinase
VTADSENDVTLAEMAESDVLARIFPRLPESAHTLLGPGDDAAVIAAPDGRFVVTTDMMVEGPDFRQEWSSPFAIGFKIAAVNLADVAAMGAKPTALVVALGAPVETKISVLEGIADGLRAACEELAPGCGVVGGDLSSAPALTLSVTAFGDLESRDPVTRSGAQVGDIVAVCGDLGLAGMGLDLLFVGRQDDASVAPLVLAQVAPRPPIAAGVLAAQAGATSAMDISDGLVLDASRLAEASRVSIVLDQLAFGEYCARFAEQALAAGFSEEDLVEKVLFSGESHALLATFPTSATLPQGFTLIGFVDDQRVAGVYLGDATLPVRGWNPFGG